MAGTPLKNLRMFEELCGKNALQSVILITTMWDEVDEKVGETREKELKSKYWRSMLERGSTTGRFMRTRESAFNLIYPLIVTANEQSSVLLQKELVDMDKKLPSTSDGRQLVWEMEVLVRKRQDILLRIGNEMKRTDGDKMTLEALHEEHQRLQNNLEATVNEMRRLKLPLGYRLLNMIFNSNLKFESSRSIFNLRRRLGQCLPSKMDVKNSNTASTTDFYVSDSQSMNPGFEEDHSSTIPSTISRQQLPTPNPTSRPNDTVWPVDASEQGPEPTGSKSQLDNLSPSATQENANNPVSQDPQNKTTPGADPLLRDTKPGSGWGRFSFFGFSNTISRQQFPTPNPTSRPNDTVWPVDASEQGPGPTGSKSQVTYSSSSTTEDHAQHSAKTTPTADFLSEVVRDISN